MATGNVVLTVVDVGQGQCTFVEIYNTSGVLTNTLLFDCGTDKRSNETTKNLQYIADKVGGMTSPAFDCVIFSHSDKDHVSLMSELLEMMLPTKPAVREVWYGGDFSQYKKGSENILNYLVDNDYCTSGDIYSTSADYSGYNPDTKRYSHYLWRSADSAVYVYPIVSNILSDAPDWDDDGDVPMGKTAVDKNRVSIIAGLYYAGVSYVICGDAINDTMAAVNARFNGGTTVFDNNMMTTLPHHGSRTTGYAVKSGATASKHNALVVWSFQMLLKSKTVSVSAYAKHSHPSLELMVAFAPGGKAIIEDPRLVEDGSHVITANIDRTLTVKDPTKKIKTAKGSKPSEWTVPKGSDASFETITNTFTTHYSVNGKVGFSYQLNLFSVAGMSKGLVPSATLNNFACWRYTTASNGTVSVAGLTNLSSTGKVFTQNVSVSKTAAPPEQLSAGIPAMEAASSPFTGRHPAAVRQPAAQAGRTGSRIKQFH